MQPSDIKKQAQSAEDYADTFEVMEEAGVFSREFVEKLREDIQDIVNFVDIFMKFLSKNVDS